MPEMTTGPCAECNTPCERETVTGLGAEAYNAIPLLCGPCEQAKFEALDAEDQARIIETLNRRKRDRIKNADFPALLANVNLNELDPTDAVSAARYWAAKGGGLLLTGPIGTGKTTIAAGALRLTLERRNGRWLSAPLMMARLGSGLDSTARAQTLSTLTGNSALVLDDLDKTRPTEYGAEQVFLVVDGAVTSGRALLVTTNLGLGQLAAKWPAPFGEAIASRLAGYCEVVAVTGDDRRLAA